MPRIERNSRTSSQQPAPENNGAGNGYQLHREHAIVHTGSIDVKIIRLDKRQLTMAVFRQLDEESIFLLDGSLRGVPWGRINYTWKGNPDDTAFHVIWQDGDYLKRSPVPEDGPDTYWRYWLFDMHSDEANKLLEYPDEPSYGRLAQWCESLAGQMRKAVERAHVARHYLLINFKELGVGVGEYLRQPDSNWCHKVFNESGCVWHNQDNHFFPDVHDRYMDGWFDLSEKDCRVLKRFIEHLQHYRQVALTEQEQQQARKKVWKATCDRFKEKFWQRVREMRQLDQLFIAC
jgi:hypothetical protein